jgi:hypothetical protein
MRCASVCGMVVFASAGELVSMPAAISPDGRTIYALASRPQSDIVLASSPAP